MRFLILFSIIFLSGAGTPTPAGDALADDSRFLDPKLHRYFSGLREYREKRLREILQLAESQLLESGDNRRDDQTAVQMLSQALPFVGREDLIAQVQSDYNIEKPCPIDADILSDIDEIASLASSARIVIINEAHNQPLHRFFAAELTDRLRSIGFKYLAVETLANPGSDFNPRARDFGDPFISLDAGYYSQEPTFAEFLLEAKRLGYRLVAYEQKESQRNVDEGDFSQEARIETRERSQVENLIASIFSRDPDAKVVIYVGHSHVYEEPVAVHDSTRGARVHWLASVLKRELDFDPVTVSQTECRSPSPSRLLLKVKDSVFYDEHPVDVVIGHPKLQFKNHRPSWRARIYQTGVDIPEAIATTRVPAIYEARYYWQPDHSVPVDRILILPGEKIQLLLPSGIFKVQGFNLVGGMSEEVLVSVP